MSFDNCFNCGEPGHFASSCPALVPDNHDKPPKPQWCGDCDKQTRLIEGVSNGRPVMRRCTCHPLAYVPLAQHRRCVCKNLVYAWDHYPCGFHQPLALT